MPAAPAPRINRGDIHRFTAGGNFVANLGTFQGPAGLNADDQGNLVVIEENAARVRVIAPDGMDVLSFGTPGKDPGQLFGPIETVVDESANFYVVDQFNQFVSVFDLTGAFVGTFGSARDSDGQFGIGYGGRGSLYTFDFTNHQGGRVQTFKVTVTAPAAAPPAA